MTAPSLPTPTSSAPPSRLFKNAATPCTMFSFIESSFACLCGFRPCAFAPRNQFRQHSVAGMRRKRAISLKRRVFHFLTDQRKGRQNVAEFILSQPVQIRDHPVQLRSQPRSFRLVRCAIAMAAQTDLFGQVVEFGGRADQLGGAFNNRSEFPILLSQSRNRKLVDVKHIQVSRNHLPDVVIDNKRIQDSLNSNYYGIADLSVV